MVGQRVTPEELLGPLGEVEKKHAPKEFLGQAGQGPSYVASVTTTWLPHNRWKMTPYGVCALEVGIAAARSRRRRNCTRARCPDSAPTGILGEHAITGLPLSSTRNERCLSWVGALRRRPALLLPSREPHVPSRSDASSSLPRASTRTLASEVLAFLVDLRAKPLGRRQDSKGDDLT